MPTVLYVLGWRFYFYANERNEPMHIHVQKAEENGKFWIDVENYSVIEAKSYKMSSQDIREVKKIIFDHFDLVVKAWKDFQKRRIK